MRLKEHLDKILSTILVGLMGIMVINVVWQVASRYLLKSPSVFTDELAGFLLIWVGLLGAGYATGQKLHLAIDLFPNQLKADKRKYLEIVINALISVFAILVMIVGGARLVYLTLSLNQLSAALKLPLGYVYIVVPISGVIITYYCFESIYEKIKG